MSCKAKKTSKTVAMGLARDREGFRSLRCSAVYAPNGLHLKELTQPHLHPPGGTDKQKDLKRLDGCQQ